MDRVVDKRDDFDQVWMTDEVPGMTEGFIVDKERWEEVDGRWVRYIDEWHVLKLECRRVR